MTFDELVSTCARHLKVLGGGIRKRRRCGPMAPRRLGVGSHREQAAARNFGQAPVCRPWLIITFRLRTELAEQLAPFEVIFSAGEAAHTLPHRPLVLDRRRYYESKGGGKRLSSEIDDSRSTAGLVVRYHSGRIRPLF